MSQLTLLQEGSEAATRLPLQGRDLVNPSKHIKLSEFITIMKKNINYYFLILLLCFITISCSKESDEVAPTASLSSESVDNTKYCPPPVVDICAFSQGRFFNRGGGGPGAGWGTVTVGNRTLTEGVDTLPATTPEERALLQAATLILSARALGISLEVYIASLPEDVRNAYLCIVDYYTDGTPNCNLQNAAGTIGDWIDANHCEDSEV